MFVEASLFAEARAVKSFRSTKVGASVLASISAMALSKLFWYRCFPILTGLRAVDWSRRWDACPREERNDCEKSRSGSHGL